MHWIDGHLDLAYIAECGRNPLHEVIADDAATGCVSLPALRSAGMKIACGTIFTEPGTPDPTKPYMYEQGNAEDAERAGLRQLEIYERWNAAGEIELLDRGMKPLAGGRRNRGDDRRIGMIILMEGADPIRSPEALPMWYRRGLRMVGLTWATGTRYAGGNASLPGEGPLTNAGLELIHALDELKIVHDVSHLSDAAFDGVMEHARGTVVASHSNCRALVDPKQRHLRDEQIEIIGARGGVIGLNLYSAFLVKASSGRRATIADCVAHLDHVAEVMGHRRGVALGSDMDGGFGPDQLPVGLDHPSKLESLCDALRDAGWSDGEIEGFAHKNWERIFKLSA